MTGPLRPSLADLTQYVADVLRPDVAPDDDYQPGRLVLGTVEFVPYVLTGMAAAMVTPTSGVRADALVTVPIADDAGATASVSRHVTLHGPGDVLGLDRGQIVRRYPAPGSVDSEETFHAHVEFDRPELPWAFSAESPGDRMRAWLALVVVTTAELSWDPEPTGPLPSATVPGRVLPPAGEGWAFAHAQAVGGSAPTSVRFSTSYAPANVSRLLAARTLTQDTDYLALLVPTTEAGRLAGLGLDGGHLGAAWTGAEARVTLPVYDHWTFRTAADGDFVRLARRLRWVDPPWSLGRRILDTGTPGGGLPDLPADAPGRRQVVRGALFADAAVPPPDVVAALGPDPDAARWDDPHVDTLRGALDRPATTAGLGPAAPGAPSAVPGAEDLPLVTARLYGGNARGVTTITGSDWFAELNLSPAHRVVAGLGTRVVQRDQEQLMQAAWAQLDVVRTANRALATADLGRRAAAAVHRRVSALDLGPALQLTRPAAARVRLDGSALTVTGQTARSATPAAAVDGPLRRLTRPAGPLGRRLGPGAAAMLRGLVGQADVARDFTTDYRPLHGIRRAPTLAEVLGMARDEIERLLQIVPAPETFAEALEQARLEQELAVDIGLHRDGEPYVGYELGSSITAEVVATVQRAAVTDAAAVDVDVVRAQSIAALAAAIATAALPGTDVLHELAGTLETSVRDAVHLELGVDHPGVDHLGVDHLGVDHLGVEVHTGGFAGADLLRHQAVGRAALVPVTTTAEQVTLPTAPGGPGLGVAPGRPIVRGGWGGATIGGAGGAGLLQVLPTDLDATLANRLAALAAGGVEAYRAQVPELIGGGDSGALTLPVTPTRPRLDIARADLAARLDPDRTVVDDIRARLDLGAVRRGGATVADPFAGGTITPVVAAPRFDRPMYQALAASDREWLIPGLGALDRSDLVTVLAANDAFIEAFLVGASDEMGRELLWRGYPTDARGTCFHRFWVTDRDELTGPVDRFAPLPLGRHVKTGPPGTSGRAVVVVRGEVVRRYPDLTVLALRQQGVDPDGRPVLPDAPTGPDQAAPLLFHARLAADLVVVGFDVTTDVLRSDGWWVVIGEHPQSTRFRRSEPDVVGTDDVAFARAGAAADGAEVAVTRLAEPTRVAFPASGLLRAGG